MWLENQSNKPSFSIVGFDHVKDLEATKRHDGKSCRFVVERPGRFSTHQKGCNKMRKLLVLTSWTMILLLTLPASVAGASSPLLDVNFEVPTHFTPGDTGPSFGPFTATGPAVDAGIICPSGDTIDIYSRVTGFPSGKGMNFLIVKRFTCDDGSGDFLVQLAVRTDRKGDNFNWMIVDGTGDYVKLHGTGQGVGLPADYGILDLYEGVAHIN